MQINVECTFEIHFNKQSWRLLLSTLKVATFHQFSTIVFKFMQNGPLFIQINVFYVRCEEWECGKSGTHQNVDNGES